MLQFLATVAIAAGPPSASPPRLDVGAIDRERILTAANAALRHEPVTVTSASSPRSAGRLHDYFSEADYWFVDDATRMSPHLRWTTDKDGIEERDAKNTHASCWALQAAAFARLAGNDEVLRYCRDRFKTVLLPSQMAADGSFPEELRRTKPYGYSLFNLEALAGIAQLLSTPRGRVADPAAPSDAA